jgi:hypothetical protein
MPLQVFPSAPCRMTETVIWRRIMDDQSFEQATFTFGISAHQIEGIVLVAQAGAPLRLEYKVNCDARWSTKYCLIRQNFMGHQTNLALRAEGDRWQVNLAKNCSVRSYQLERRIAPRSLIGVRIFVFGVDSGALPFRQSSRRRGG